ncbi:dihydrodipicolinate synthase family protein [Acuticoccus sp. MNP-M23]|uniref:dihydrodipicolinate synthase family protein n=1 Tax=Acuticoccus sp. MNP-M23 TaxID=3072793 RepID=UPI002815322D|nr:dihydrodipicolinate synthase family protein [Acuticoccus sp. MNP-M23]WMS41438.1 dihydrodipicolinate synthase family protein [Acuticoccus sp. MNP-M23]
MANSDLRGIVTAAATPVDASFEVDVPRLAQHCARLLEEGCTFVSTFGSTGEGASLSTAQKIAAMAVLKAEGADLGRHIPAIMTPSVDEAAGMAKAAAVLGCRAILVLPPFYYGAGDAGIVAFVDEMLKRAGRPDIDLLLYNIPQLSRFAYTPALVDAMQAAFGEQVVGLKDSTGDVANGVMLAERYPNLSIFTGDDRVLTPLLAAGGAGMIGGMPNLFAADLCAIYDANGNDTAAPLVEKQAARIAAVDNFGGIGALKAGLAARDGHPGWCRAVPPLQPIGANAAKQLFEAFGRTGAFLTENV